jgi:hypothetical protein
MRKPCQGTRPGAGICPAHEAEGHNSGSRDRDCQMLAAGGRCSEMLGTEEADLPRSGNCPTPGAWSRPIGRALTYQIDERGAADATHNACLSSLTKRPAG